MRALLPSVLTAALGIPAAANAFVVSDIRVEGLQRISAGSVFAALPINVGDDLTQSMVQGAIKSLFSTGNFDDIRIGRDGDVMVIWVEERPSISEITIDGNKAIETEALLEGLKNSGLAEGQVFKRSTLEGMKMELTRQYVSQGRYDASIDTDIVAQPRNRVAININVNEGSTASIKQINVVGNTVFDDEELISLFELKTTGWFSWMTGDDRYSREKLTGDLEKLTSHYQDRGYINFRLDSTQVSITPDREAVYITANISEGDKYRISGVDLSGDIVLPEDELRRFVLLQEGQTFSQSLLTNTEELLTKRLGNEGYNFAQVNAIPELDDEEKSVNIKFFIDPGKRTYVRRIDFSGNTKTSDEVLRREMRQMEAAPASSAKIEQSRVRLERLGFFKEAKVNIDEVAGSDDLIDLTYTVEEQASGSIGASIGFAQDSGLLLGANIQQNNFLGTGKQVGIGVNKSDYVTNLRFSYVDPYYTEDGVSRGFSVFFRSADLEEVNIASYTTDTYGFAINFGYPIKETERLGFSFGFTNTQIDAGRGAVQEIKGSPRPIQGVDYYFDQDGSGTEVATSIGNLPAGSFTDPTLVRDGFLDTHGDDYNNFPVTASWSQSTLNRGLLATRGASQSLSIEISLPGSDLEYYKLTYNGQIFIPITDALTLRLRGELGYADGYGNTEQLPFFENFFSGGFGSVRGYKSNTLGPHSTPAQTYDIDVRRDIGGTAQLAYRRLNGELVTDPYEYDSDPFGGNVLVEGSAELLFPLPFVKDQRSLRSAFFVDAGNVFSTDCRSTQVNCYDVDLGELRYSAGVGVTWITGFGPLTFSLAKALNQGEDDDTEVFQFSLGRGF